MPTLAKFIAMPPPMVPAPMTPTFLIGSVGVSSGTSGIFRAWRSAKKYVALRRRLRAGHQLDEQLALGLHALVERQVHRRFDGLDVVLGRHEAAELARGKPELFAEFRKANARKFRGFLAPEYNIRCIEAAVNLPFDQGIATERKLFMELMTGTQSAAQRYVFFAERQVWKIPDVPDDTPPIPVKKIGVIGAGTMGGGIAMNFANVGIPVTIVEAKQDALDRGLGVIRKNYDTHREARQAQARGRREAHGPAHRHARLRSARRLRPGDRGRVREHGR